ncbi:xanthine dehydrogenase family protein subunit M [Conexibacter sp. CPCC 206217]|uniref:FAD binding domain-containing protein n=1 Tax=Conexibacter sp. CPCC 206217 TaxID=3064574 RepID=UPI0027262163|nr:FAD binding domain-containing protein [Conexibacter sp. CPCC 206217]MDO8212495.1 FAD binding domain-containing protein [Conexibacter sp. CPCC 206217]
MKPAAFDYAAPRTLDEALALLDGDDDAKAIAGGQSLVPVMNFRLATPARLVDLNGIAELTYLRRRDGALRIGALTRHATLEHSELVARAAPLLRQAVKHVGHPAIRTRGTIGGSCSHADPTAELPVALTALDARFHLRSRTGERVLEASDFFVSQLTTALEEGELVVEIEIPPLPPGARTAFEEYARTHGDWAICGAAVVVAPEHAAIALLGAGPTPRRASAAEAALLAGASAAEAAALAGALLADPWKRSLTTSLVRDALQEAGA